MYVGGEIHEHLQSVAGSETLDLVPKIYSPASFPRLQLSPQSSDLAMQLPFHMLVLGLCRSPCSPTSRWGGGGCLPRVSPALLPLQDAPHDPVYLHPVLLTPLRPNQVGAPS